MRTAIIIMAAIALLSGCSRHSIKTIERSENTTITEQKKDSLYTHTPVHSEVSNSLDIEAEPCPPCPEGEFLPFIPNETQPPAQVRVKPQSLSTDTLRVQGKFSDAWAVVSRGRLYAGITEGKPFDIMLEDITIERNIFKQLYEKETTKEQVKPKPWNLYVIIVLLLLLNIALLSIIIKR